MIFKEIHKNLFEMDDKYYLVHCIAKDARMGAGIAVDFVKKFSYLTQLRKMDLEVGTCVKLRRVFNLITKSKSTGKPTHDSLYKALNECKEICVEDEIKYLAMPKIGCGLDRLQWSLVRENIKGIFDDTDIEIIVCVK